jgi:hypothetical protein
MSGQVIRRLLLVGLAFVAPIACSDDGGMTPSDPTDPGALGLAVGVRIDTTELQTSGEFSLELIPSTPGGTSLVGEEWTTTVTLNTAATPHSPLQTLIFRIPGRSRPRWYDASSSMQTVIGFERQDARNCSPRRSSPNAANLSLFEFTAVESSVTRAGQGSGTAEWTSSLATFEAGLAQMETPTGGFTLYSTNAAIVRWMICDQCGGAARAAALDRWTRDRHYQAGLALRCGALTRTRIYDRRRPGPTAARPIRGV